MRVKLLEVRDRATFIPVFAMRMVPTVFDDGGYDSQRYLLRRAGYSCSDDDPIILFGHLQGRQCHYDAYNWPPSSRTMREAHKYVEEHWNELEDGDVIDIEFILGEKPERKTSERYGD